MRVLSPVPTGAAGLCRAPGAVPGEPWCQTGSFWASDELSWSTARCVLGKLVFLNAWTALRGALELWGTESLQSRGVIDTGEKRLGRSGMGATGQSCAAFCLSGCGGAGAIWQICPGHSRRGRGAMCQCWRATVTLQCEQPPAAAGGALWMVQDQLGRVLSARRGGCVRLVLGFVCRRCGGPGDLGWGCAGSHL